MAEYVMKDVTNAALTTNVIDTLLAGLMALGNILSFLVGCLMMAVTIRCLKMPN